MSKYYSDVSSDLVDISSAEGASAPRKKCKQAEVQTGEELLPQKIDVETAPDSRVDVATSSTGVKYQVPKVDENEILQFLKRVYPIAMR